MLARFYVSLLLALFARVVLCFKKINFGSSLFYRSGVVVASKHILIVALSVFNEAASLGHACLSATFPL